MKIELTNNQFEYLMKLTYLGNWMINAFRLKEEQVKKFEDLLEHILSLAQKNGFDRYVEYDKELKKHFPSSELEKDVDQYIDEYEDESFWEELTYRLARRDFVEEYGEKAVKKMTWEERIKKEHPFIERFADEFEQDGINNLMIEK